MRLITMLGIEKLNLFAVKKILRWKSKLCISLWHEFVKPPYGGGNQFMLALENSFRRLGIIAVRNMLSSMVDVHICNSAFFDTIRFEKQSRRYPVKMIHRIDGPICYYRGQGMEEDEKIHSLNTRYATATVYQSNYCLRKSRELGFRAVSPVVIYNAVNSTIFNNRNREPFSRKRKIKLISSSWSDNPRKGGPLFKWIDQSLDWNRFEYTFVGRVQEQFEHIRHIPPQDSVSLAELLRQHDIFIAASRHDPCSNALLEAQACGLPALYLDDGGHPELVKDGGLPFSGEKDILHQLDLMVRGYEKYQNSIFVTDMDGIAEKYANLARRIL